MSGIVENRETVCQFTSLLKDYFSTRSNKESRLEYATKNPSTKEFRVCIWQSYKCMSGIVENRETVCQFTS